MLKNTAFNQKLTRKRKIKDQELHLIYKEWKFNNHKAIEKLKTSTIINYQ